MLKKAVLLVPVFLCGINQVPIYSLERLDDRSLKQIYGQGGVEIEIDNMSIRAEIREMRYTDTDGTFDGRPGSVFISNTRTYQRFHAIVDETSREGLLETAYNDERILGEYAIRSYADTSNLKIDIVNELPVLTKMHRYNMGADLNQNLRRNMSVSGILITLPTLEIVADAPEFSIGIRQEGAINNNAVFFECTGSGKSVMAILRGKIEIAAH